LPDSEECLYIKTKRKKLDNFVDGYHLVHTDEENEERENITKLHANSCPIMTNHTLEGMKMSMVIILVMDDSR